MHTLFTCNTRTYMRTRARVIPYGRPGAAARRTGGVPDARGRTLEKPMPTRTCAYAPVLRARAAGVT